MKKAYVNDFTALLKANFGEVPEEFVEYLKSSGYFSLPASVGHHSNLTGGLVNHSMTVAETLLTLTTRNHLQWSRSGSPVIVGLFHDICKMEAYEADHSGRGFGYTDTRNHLYTGHGEKSVLMLAPWILLTAEEIACIRWHMGAFDEKENWNHYTAAVRQFPNVLWTHQADMIATHILLQ